jgi:hypothetical protein
MKLLLLSLASFPVESAFKFKHIFNSIIDSCPLYLCVFAVSMLLIERSSCCRLCFVLSSTRPASLQCLPLLQQELQAAAAVAKHLPLVAEAAA